MDDLNATLFYTLGTVAQAVAGTLGLFAAFMMIRINAFNQVLYERVRELHSTKNTGEQALEEARWRGDVGDVLRYYRSLQEHARTNPGSERAELRLSAHQEGQLVEAEGMLARKAALLDLVAVAVAASGITIVYCFVGLPLTPVVARHRYVALVMLLGAAVLGSACIVRLLWLMARALKEA